MIEKLTKGININTTLLVVFLLSFIFRLILINVGYHGDLNNNISWGTLALDRGLSGFYESGNWPYSAPNQPPLTIITFYFARLAWQTVENLSWQLNNSYSFFPSNFIWFWESKGMILLVKLPSIIADIVIAYYIYLFFTKQNKAKIGFNLALIWLFNPVTWYNSSIWGQTDSIVNLLGLVSLIFLLEKRLVYFSAFFTLSLLFKGSLTVYIPILAIIIWKSGFGVGEYIKAIGAGLVTILSITIWFHPHIDLFSWLFNLYNNRILPGEIGFLTANAFNFWWVVNPGKILDSVVFFGLPARIWGFGICLVIFGLIFKTLPKRNKSVSYIYSLGVFSFAVFMFLTRMHERYLYPLFPLFTIILGYYPKMILLYVLISILHLINLYHLFWVPSMPQIEVFFMNNSFVQNLLSWTNILFFGVFLVLYLLEDRRTNSSQQL